MRRVSTLAAASALLSSTSLALETRHLPDGFEEGMQHGMISWHVPLDRYPDTYNGQPLGIAALAAGFQGWALRRTHVLERWLLIAAGFALAYPSWMTDLAGIVVVIGVLAVQALRPQPQPQAAHDLSSRA